MKRERLTAIFLAVIALFSAVRLEGQSARVESVTTAGSGWHPWYELKADPEESNHLILCGSSWNAAGNAFYGFVDASTDGGKTWRTVLQDKRSPWVSEQSCAFGSNHMAYFISEASPVVDGYARFGHGVTQLFVSTDGGHDWVKASSTAWADYSTSAVSPSTGDLVTFYNDKGTYDKGRHWGSSVAAIVFSPDGKQVFGPILNPTMKDEDYQGALPSNAISIKNGRIAALYASARKTSAGSKYDIGLERIDLLPSPSATFYPIASMRRCIHVDGNSLIYDKKRDELLVAYGADARNGCQLILATSKDGGKSWNKRTLVGGPRVSEQGIEHLSLAQGPDGLLGILWEDSGNWYFSLARDFTMLQSPIDLTDSSNVSHVAQDSLMTVIRQPNGPGTEVHGPITTVDVNVRSLPGVVFRSSGLVASAGNFVAVVPRVVEENDCLKSFVVSPAVIAIPAVNPVGRKRVPAQYVTQQIALLYGGAESFNNMTGTLSIDLELANRGDRPMKIPIKIEVVDVSSAMGSVTILNATNGLKGPGAIWDISRSVTGNQLAPGSATNNSFPLLFHLDTVGRSAPTENLLNLRLRVLASMGSHIRTTKFDQ